jgi:MoCo/4Fe-4S cofactor protein with predicted Tat translocation signal
MDSNRFEHLDLAAVRAKLSSEQGPRFWRSLDELAGTKAFEDFLHREFPRFASEWDSGDSGRRKFLQVAGASIALAGLTACTRQPAEKIVPYVKAPEDIVPGKPLFFATSVSMNGVGAGVLAESHMGRPTKIEGNPEHPGSLGAADVFAQASVLQLYDPDRSQTVLKYGEIATWSAFQTDVAELRKSLQGRRGAGLRILTETVTSPTLASEIEGILALYPEAKWAQYDPTGPHGARLGSQAAFGEIVGYHFNVAAAKVILAVDSDFLTSGPGSVRYAREFADGRRVRGGNYQMNRLYAVESTPSNTGGKADHRWAMKPSDIGPFLAALARELGIDTGSLSPGQAPSWLKPLADDLKANAGASLIVVGDEQPAAVHALAHAINVTLGNAGRTVIYRQPLEARPADQVGALKQLVADMESGSVEVLLIVGGNPVYNAPADLNFSAALDKVRMRLHWGLYNDETAERCQWHIPGTHALEAWGDVRAYDGTVTLVQPLIEPLYKGKSEFEFLSAFGEQAEKRSYDAVRAYWQKQRPGADFEAWWRKVVHDGLVADTAPAARAVALRAGWQSGLTFSGAGNGLEIIFRPDPTVFDGRFANNGWLQELPKPLTKTTWDNVVLLSVRTAERLGLRAQDEVQLHLGGKVVAGAPVWILPGHADDCATVHLGYGRARAGQVGTGIGFNVYPLRTSDALGGISGLEIRKTGGKVTVACTAEHWSMEGRHLVRQGTIEDFRAHPEHPAFVHAVAHDPPPEFSFYPEHKYDGYAWGMAIDLNACNGCNACIVACQAENNIPVVGKDQVDRGREMQWLRVDRYFEGDLDNPRVHHQPLPCQQCENAPCEVVCPVAATVHSDEGLNDMVYNRCVGTRYCSNNCPYKVRRFNFYLYADFVTEVTKMQRNPDVSIRSRGVMEKCTYCVQRINQARIDSKREDRDVRDGEIVTACQQTCPTQAIAFGDINNPESRVAKLKKEQLNYGILTDLNTRPRTTYLASLRNPNPAIPDTAAKV